MSQMIETLIAPCGMNCRVCVSFQRPKNPCLGCRNMDEIIYLTKGSRVCVIKHCPEQVSEAGFCVECGKFPCKRLKDLDKRYRTKYHMSMIENLRSIQENGMTSFLETEENRWKCPDCSSIVTVHKSSCMVCHTVIFDEVSKRKE